MEDTYRQAIRLLLFPSLPEGMEPWDVLDDDSIPDTIEREVIPPGSAENILREIPDLADFYSVETLNEILDDLWIYDRKVQKTGMLLAANPAIDVEKFASIIDSFETETDTAMLSENDRSLVMTRIFIRHNPNAGELPEVLSRPDAHEDYYAFVAKADAEAVLMLARQIFYHGEGQKKRWTDVRKIPVFLNWFRDVATDMNEPEIVSLVENKILRLNALLEQGDESIQSTFGPLRIPEKYRDLNLPPTVKHFLYLALDEFRQSIITGNEGKLGSDGTTVYDDFNQSLNRIMNAQQFVRELSLLEEVVWDLNLVRSLGNALGLAPNLYMMERIL